jgi:hypothetical protein
LILSNRPFLRHIPVIFSMLSPFLRLYDLAFRSGYKTQKETFFFVNRVFCSIITLIRRVASKELWITKIKFNYKEHISVFFITDSISFVINLKIRI